MKKWQKYLGQFLATKTARRQPATVNWYRARLAHWTGYAAGQSLKPKRVKPADIDAFFASLAEAGYTASTRRGTETALRAFFGWLVKRGKLKRNPFDQVEPLSLERQEQPAIRLRDAYQMIRTAEAAGSPFGVRDAALMRLLLSTGARREEGVRISLDWLDLESGLVKLKGKYSHERTIPLVPTTITALRAWLDLRPGLAEGPLFVGLHPSRAGIYQQLRPSAVNEILARWHKRAGLPQAAVTNPHAWRRRFATEAAKGVDAFQLAYLMGHTDVNVTRLYIENQPDVVRGILVHFVAGPDTAGGGGRT